MPYLLDTNICVFFLRGKLNLDQINEAPRQLAAGSFIFSTVISPIYIKLSIGQTEQ